MIRALLALCLRQRAVVVALAVLLMLLGIDAARSARIDAFPEFAPPKVEIQTEAPGLSSVEVETLVTRPLEDALAGTPLVATLRSKSVLGLSSVVVLFEPGTDLFRARQLVQERVALAQPNLPTLARAPVVLSPTSSTSRVLKIGLSSPTLSRLDLSDLARWTIRPRLMAIDGVANVAVWGEARRELQVQVDPDHLRVLGLRLAEVVRATAAAVNPSTGGFVDGPNQRLAVRHPARIDDAAALAEAPLARSAGGALLRLGDAGQVVESHAPLVGDAVIDGGPGLLLIVEKQPWGNTVAITAAIDRALEDLAPALGDTRVDPTIFRPANFIARAVDNLEVALGLGCALVVVVLVIALLDWRTALISVLAIPLSLAGAVAWLHHSGATLDTMVLAGLSIALGEVVDDAIIDVENIHRRLRENAAASAPRPAFAVVLAASIEVRSAVVFASVIVVLVFLPVYLLPGLAGAFFRPLALAYVLAIAASLLVALTVTPALALLLLPQAARARAPAIRRSRLAGALALALRGRVVVLVAAVAVLAAGAVGMARLGTGFLPDFREQDFLMHWIAKPGTSVEALRRTTTRVSAELLAIAGVRNAGAHLGRAEVSDEVVGPNFGEIWVSVDAQADHAATIAAIEATLAPYAGIYHDVQTYLRERVDEVLSGGHAELVVRVLGPDLEVLDARARSIAEAVRALPGAGEVSIEALTPVPQIEIVPRREAASYGLTAADLRTQVTTLVGGTRVGEVYRALRPVAVVVWGQPGTRNDVTSLRRLQLEAPDGAPVRLGDVADVTVVATPGAIKHEGGSRRLDVACRPDGSVPLGELAAAIESVLAATPFPAAHHAELLGEAAAQRAAARALWIGGTLAVLGILLVLYADFGALRPTLVVAATLPFAIVGAVAGAHVQGGVLSLGSLVGFVTVLGIAARNGIMLVSHYRHLQLHEGVAFGEALVLRGTLERVAPILMTACATGLALVPLVWLGDRPGQEIEHPMAVVILGGLVTSTLLNLVVTPAAYLAFGRTRTHDEDGSMP